MALKTEAKHPGEGVQSLAPGDRSKDNHTVVSGQNLVAGEVCALILAAVAAADGGNTGDGTMGAVTISPDVEIGDYTLSITGLGATLVAASDADVGNTGDGTMDAAPTVGSQGEVGDYILTCLNTGPGVAASGTGAADAGAHSGVGNTGNGTITASPATGANAKVGTYRAICVGVAANLGEFLITDPDGIELGTALVATEFSVGAHVTFTIADGGTDFDEGDVFTIVVAGANSGTFSVISPSGFSLPDAVVAVAYDTDHVDFTIADGATDFAVDDFFTVTVTQVDAPVFSLETPSGVLLAAGIVAVAYSGDHLNFTLADGATDFAVADFFLITVTEGNVETLDPDEDDGAQIAAAISWDNVDASSAAKLGTFVVRDAEYRLAALTWSHVGITQAEQDVAVAQLRERGIILR